jgi:predicted TIM-barrel fold metal-dependent hydrolase
MRFRAFICLVTLMLGINNGLRAQVLNKDLASTVPIADVHMHIYGKRLNGYSIKWFKDHMNAKNVRWGGGVGNYIDNAHKALGYRYIAAYGQREFLRTFRNDGEDALQNPDTPRLKKMLSKAETLFEIGKIKGFGEIHTNNASSGPPAMRREMRLKNPFTEALLKIANKYEGFVQFHAEYDENLKSDVKELAEAHPRAILILSHCVPNSSASELEAILNTAKNVVCEISGENGPGVTEEVEQRLEKKWEPFCGRMYCKTGLKKEWKTLIEKYPGKFMLGSDPCCDIVEFFPKIISEIREYFLPYLSESALRRVAYENAVSLLKLENP